LRADEEEEGGKGGWNDGLEEKGQILRIFWWDFFLLIKDFIFFLKKFQFKVIIVSNIF
jgi:hypothetical protein